MDGKKEDKSIRIRLPIHTIQFTIVKLDFYKEFHPSKGRTKKKTYQRLQ